MPDFPSVVDVAFGLRGDPIPLDHGYHLFAAVSRLIPRLHHEPSWGVHPVFGERTNDQQLELCRRSLLKIRLPSTCIGDLIPLVGAAIDVGGSRLRIAPPRVFPLEPAAYLKARLVTIKGFADAESSFASAVRRQLARLPGLDQDPERIDMAVGRRRVTRIDGRSIVGFAVSLGGLEANASIAVQTSGLGGRRHMGAGLFVPVRHR